MEGGEDSPGFRRSRRSMRRHIADRKELTRRRDGLASEADEWQRKAVVAVGKAPRRSRPARPGRTNEGNA